MSDDEIIITDPWFVAQMMEGLCAFILWCAMAHCTCQWCSVYTRLWDVRRREGDEP